MTKPLVDDLRSWIPGAGPAGGEAMFWRGERRMYQACFEAADEIEQLHAALSASRGQWIHSVNARQCLEALGEASPAEVCSGFQYIDGKPFCMVCAQPVKVVAPQPFSAGRTQDLAASGNDLKPEWPK